MARAIFVPLEVNFADDKDIAKVARFGRDARAVRDLLVQMWCYCKREMSDGHVPLEQVGKLAYPDTAKVGERDADRLVEIGVVERTRDGYYLPGYLKRNKSRAQIEAISKAKATAGRKGGIASGEARRDEAHAKQGASPMTNTEDRGQRTEDRGSESKEGGDRHLTLADTRASYPSHCLDHRYVENPGPCGGCKESRLADEAKTKRDREESTAEAQAACTHCDPDGWELDEHGDVTAKKCQRHRRTA